MSSIQEIPEIRSRSGGTDLLRIPDQLDVPLSKRVRSIIDDRAFQRLHRISQLGLVSLVYPGAKHTRFEHSLGVYRNALLFLRQLSRDPRFDAVVDRQASETLIIAALLHDIGHWPYCHPIEDLGLEAIPEHESLAEEIIAGGSLASIIEQQWQCDPPLGCFAIERRASDANPSVAAKHFVRPDRYRQNGLSLSR